MTHRLFIRALAAALFLAGCDKPTLPDAGATPCVPGTATLDEIFAQHLRPKCLVCHGQGTGQAGLFFTDAPGFYAATVNVASTTDRTARRINPAHPESSHLMFRLGPDAPLPQRMPQGGPYLDDDALHAIEGWICAGAPAPAPVVDAGTDAGVDAGLPDAGPQDAGLALSSFSPQAGVVGTRVTLTGTGFSTTASEDLVTFAGVAAPVQSATGNSLQVDVPPDAGSGLIRVTVFGQSVTSATAFTVVPGTPAPTLTTVTPATVIVGSAMQTLVLDGQSFLASSVASIDGTPVPTTFVNATRLSAVANAALFAQAGTHGVTVITMVPDGGAGGGTSAALTLTVQNPAPVLTSITPSSVASGGAAFALSLAGEGFVVSSEVELDGAPVATTFVSLSALTAQLPSFNSAATHNLTVRNPAPGGGVSVSRSLTVQALPQPSISTLAPNPAPANQAFTLTLSGANFTCAGAGPVVLFDGGVFTPTSCAPTTLSASIPSTGAGTSDVRVRNPNNDLSAPVALTLVAPNPVPTVSTLVPAQVNSGSGAQTLTVQGSDFISSSVVRVDGTGRSTTFVDANTLTASLPGSDVSAAGTHGITVFTPAPGGGTSNSIPLTVVFVNPAPALTSLSPSTVVTGSGARQVTINGAGFVGVSQATFEGSPRTTSLVSSNVLSVSLTSADVATPGVFSIAVTNPAPGGGTSSLSLSVGSPVPSVTSLSPCGVVAGAGFTLTINGSGFLSTTTVTVGGMALPATLVNSTRLTVALPGSLVGTAPANRALRVVTSNPAPGGGDSTPFVLGVASQTRSLAAHVQPIFNAACASTCHAAGFPSGGLDLSSGAAGGNLIGVGSNCNGSPRVVACGPLASQSLLVDKLEAGQNFTSPACGSPMPASGFISAVQFQSVVDWIAQGAPP